GFPYSFLSDILKAGRTSNEPLFILMLDMIQNPQNLGSLIRSAEAVGVHGVVLPLARAAGITPAVVHASSGAVEHVQVCQSNLAQAIAECKEAGAWVVGLEGGDRAQPAESIRLDGSLVLVVGNEGEGIRPLVARSCDVLMRLPMRGKVDSLNAAAAGTVALYLALMARRQGK
ncbi:MAG: RNA methyltransferase, partial [Chloroflexi bacterium]|nr:RNA methyltransferase [Chloroflexota bacterium]